MYCWQKKGRKSEDYAAQWNNKDLVLSARQTKKELNNYSIVPCLHLKQVCLVNKGFQRMLQVIKCFDDSP